MSKQVNSVKSIALKMPEEELKKRAKEAIELGKMLIKQADMDGWKLVKETESMLIVIQNEAKMWEFYL